MNYTSSLGEIFSYVVSYISLFIIVFNAIALPILIFKMKLKHHRKLMQAYLKDILDNVNYMKISGWLYHSVFAFRRFLFAIFVFELEHYLVV